MSLPVKVRIRALGGFERRTRSQQEKDTGNKRPRIVWGPHEAAFLKRCTMDVELFLESNRPCLQGRTLHDILVMDQFQVSGLAGLVSIGMFYG